MSKNDNTILALQEKIAAKEEELNNAKFAFKPKTNCVLYYDGEEYNLNLCTSNDAKILLCKLYMLVEYYDKLQSISKGFLSKEPLMLNGFDINDWIEDIDNKLRAIELKEEENKLKAYKKKLDKLLSDDKKTELLLQEIEDDLK
jgi:Fe-S-cluster containining protein